MISKRLKTKTNQNLQLYATYLQDEVTEILEDKVD